MDRKLGGIAVVVLLAGCQSMIDPGPTAEQAANALNSRYAGRPAAEMLAHFGPPSTTFESGDMHVLQWNHSGTMRLHENVTSTTSGRVGDGSAYPYSAPVPYQETTTTRQGYNVDVSCMMQAGVKADETIDRVGIGGQMGACDYFLQ